MSQQGIAHSAGPGGLADTATGKDYKSGASNVGGLLFGGCASQHCIACSADPGAQADTAAAGVAVSTTLNQGSVVDHAYQQGTAATGLRTSHVWGTLSMCAAYRLCMQPAGPPVKTQDVTVGHAGNNKHDVYTYTGYHI